MLMAFRVVWSLMDLQVAQILDPGHGENIHSNLILRCPAGASKEEVGHQRCQAI